MPTSTRFNTGLEILKQVGGADFDRPLNQLRLIAPDLARCTVEFCYGDIMSRQELDLQTRQLCTVAALTGMGNAMQQLTYHIHGALNAGCAPAAVVEVILVCTVFAGFPSAGNALTLTKEIFAERGITFNPEKRTATDDRYEKGMKALEEISAGAGKQVTQQLRAISPDLARFIIEFSYGDILSRPIIANRMKELAIISLLTALGTAQPQLKVHISAALNVGVSEVEIIEAIQQMAIYAGFPAALNGVFTAQETFAARNLSGCGFES